MESKARAFGATELRPSGRKGKEMAALFRGRWIHFGARGYEDYTTHGDLVRRAAYRKRHAGSLLANGRLAYTVKTTPAYWAYHILW